MKPWNGGYEQDSHQPKEIGPNDRVRYILYGQLKVHRERAADVCWPDVLCYEVVTDE